MKPTHVCIGVCLSFLFSCSPTELNTDLISNVEHQQVNQSVTVDNDDNKNKMKLDLDGDLKDDLLVTAFNSQPSQTCGNYDINFASMSSTLEFSFTEASVNNIKYISNIIPGEAIGPALSWLTMDESAGLIYHDTHGSCARPEITSMFFASPTSRQNSTISVMPFRMRNLSNGNIYYGWMRLNGEYIGDEKNTVKLTVEEIAYNTRPGEILHAGVTE
jgi:hypothetical protein